MAVAYVTKNQVARNAAEVPPQGDSTIASPDTFLREKDVAADVRSGLQIFTVAVKNCGLYPANNRIRQASIEKIIDWFTVFLDEHESLRLFVDMDGFLYQGVQVLQENPTESAIIFPFFRDGVQWIEFLEGLDSKELLTLMEHLNRFRMLREEDEDDLVTAMWSSDFQFIKYKTANEFWEIDPVTEIASLKVGFAPPTDPNKQAESQQTLVPITQTKPEKRMGGKALGALLSWLHESGLKKNTESNLFPSDGQLLPPNTGVKTDDGSLDDDDFLEGGYQQQSWAISPGEKAEMEQLLANEAKKGHIGVGIDLTLALLVQHPDPQSMVPVLKFLSDIVKFALARADFSSILLILKKLVGVIQAAAPLLDNLKEEFPKWLAEESVLEGLTHIEPKMEISDRELESLSRFLKFLPVTAGTVFVDIFAKLKDERIKSCLIGAIVARSAYGGMELSLHANTVISPSDLVNIYKCFEGKDISQVVPFISGGAKHITRQVREIASRILLESNTSLISTLTHLLAEPEPSLARQIYFLLGQVRSSVVEKVLIKFLQNTLDLSINRSPELIILCYRTLGLVTSSRIPVDFTANMLLKKDLRSFLGFTNETMQTHRVGAALALHLMPPGFGTEEILSKAAHSFFRSLRQAYNEAKIEADNFKFRFSRQK
jgi:hypothetical protein